MADRISHRSRFKVPRLFRRFLLLVGAVVALVLFLLGTLLLMLNFEMFWRSYVFPRFMGPFWSTALSWEEFDASALQPGFRARGVTLRDPYSPPGERQVLRIEELEVRLSLGSDRRRLILPVVSMDGVDMVYRSELDGTSNLSRAIDRLFDDLPPERVAAAGTEPTMIPMTIGELTIGTIRYRFESPLESGEVMEFEFASRLPLFIRNVHAVDGEVLTDLPVRANGEGEWRFAVMGVETAGRGALELDLQPLTTFPRVPVRGRLDLRPAAEDAAPVIRVVATSALDRVMFRANSLPFADLDIRVLARETETVPLIRISNGTFDPLYGKFTGDVRVEESPWRDVTAALAPFVVAAPADWKLPELPAEARVQLTTTLATTGVGQYAIVDPSEALPVEISAKGEATISGLLPPALTAGYRLPPLVASMDWTLSAAKKADEAGLLLALEVASADRQAFVYTMALDGGATDKPLAFKPFGWRPRYEELMKQPWEPLGEYAFLPAFEQSLVAFGTTYRETWSLIESLGMHQGIISHQVVSRDGQLIEAIAREHLPEVQSAEKGQVTLKARREDVGGPWNLQTNVLVEGLRLAEVTDPVRVLLSSEALLGAETIEVLEFESSLVRVTGGGGLEQVLRVALPPVPLLDVGPAIPFRADLRRGTASFHGEANTVRREILEVLLRIQSLGLIDDLNTPTIDRLLGLFGFRPGDQESQAEALIQFGGRIDRELLLASRISARNVPAGALLALESDQSGWETIDVELQQGLLLDRQALTVAPLQFDLVASSHGGTLPFARVSVAPDTTPLFDFTKLQAIANRRLEGFAAQNITASPHRLRDVLASVLREVADLRSASLAPGALLMELPGLNLADFEGTLSDAGLPITTGVLTAQLRASLDPSASGAAATDGLFSLMDFRLVGMVDPLPPINGDVALAQNADQLEVTRLRASFTSDPALPPTDLTFTGTASMHNASSRWTLRLDGIHRGVIEMLRRVRTAGLGEAASLLAQLPFGQLSDIAGQSGNVGMEFTAQTDETGDHATLASTQWGRSLAVLPRYFDALSFDLLQEVSVDETRDTMRLVRLEGTLTEDGVTTPLMTLAMGGPIFLRGGTTAGEAPPAAITLTTTKDVATLARRLGDSPIPLLDRRINSGIISGQWEVLLPAGGLASGDLDSQEIENHLVMHASDVGLDRFPHLINGALSLNLVKRGRQLALEDMLASLTVGDEPTGQIEANAMWDAGADTFEGVVDFVGVRARLLEALPEALAAFARRDSSVFDMQLRFGGQPAAGRGTLATLATLRNFGIPAYRLPDGSVFRHPPLNLDGAFTISYDKDTSVVLLAESSLDLVRGTLGGGRLEPMDPALPRLASVYQSQPLRFMRDTGALARDTSAGEILRAEFGPVELAEYGALLRHVAGLPLAGGELSGTAVLAAAGELDQREERLSARMEIADAIWQPDAADTRQMNFTASFEGGRDSEFLRVDQLEFLLDFPDQGEVDHLRASGTYRTIDARHHLDLAMGTQGMRIERLVGMAADVEQALQLAAAPQAPAATATPDGVALPGWQVPANLVARFTGDFANMRYLELQVPSAQVEVTLEDRRVEVKQIQAQFAQGLVALTGHADMAHLPLRWALATRVQDLDAAPWINSFAPPELRNIWQGLLSAQLDLAAHGVAPEELAATMRGQGNISLREGRFDIPLSGAVLGVNAPLAIDLALLLRQDRVNFLATDPWNAARRVFLEGTVHHLFSDSPLVRAMLDFRRTSTVGPAGRRGPGDARWRQDLYGITAALIARLGDNGEARAELRSVWY